MRAVPRPCRQRARRHSSALRMGLKAHTACDLIICLLWPCPPCCHVRARAQVIDRQLGGSFGRDDVVLLQRFAVQCGVSLRNAGGFTCSSAAPIGAMVSPHSAGRMQAPSRPGGKEVWLHTGRSPKLMAQRPRTSDHAVQCDLLDIPPVKKRLPATQPATASAATPPVAIPGPG